MKKLLSLALCCVIAASALASCAQSAAKNYSPKITVSSSEAEESALYLTNRPQADSEKTKTFKRKIHPLRGWIFIHAAGFFDGVSAVTSRCAERIYQSRFLDKSRGVFVCRHRAVNPIFPPLSRHGAQVRLA